MCFLIILVSQCFALEDVLNGSESCELRNQVKTWTGYQTQVFQMSPHLQEDVLGSIREAVGDLLQASVVAVEGRGPLDGAVALLRAGLRVGGA